MNYSQMKKDYIKGWHTWNVRSVLSHVFMPDGFALNVAFKEYREGHYLKEVLVGRFTNEYGREPAETAFPGIHSFDDSYTQMSFKWCDMEISVESAVVDDDIVILVTPIKNQIHPPMVVLEGGFLWGRPGWVEKKSDVLVAHASTETKTVYALGNEFTDNNIPVQTAFLSVILDSEVAFSTRKLNSIEEAKSIVEKNKNKHFQQTSLYGKNQELYEGIESALGWDTIYDAKNDRVVSPVSRLWSISSGGYVLFCWDNFFAGYLASFGKWP